ncbi:MAG: SagB family peptide dehydrogenase, partial [Myxococcota bacterium]
MKGEAARSYHQATKHSELSLRQNRHRLDFDNQPLPFKIYSTLEPIPLPHELPPLEVPALEAITGAPGIAPDDSAERVPDLATLSRVLYLSAGITKRKRHPGGEVYFRAAPNTGALYHVDLYLVCGDLPDLEAGVYHFGPHDSALRRLRTGDFRSILVEAAGEEPAVSRAPAILVSASTYWRNAWKYQARAYRHCFWDGGTLHANLLAVAASERLLPRVVVGFADAPVERLLGLDPEKEGALTLVALGRASTPAPKVEEPSELHLEMRPLSNTEIEYPAIREMHVASSLGSGAEAAAWREPRYAPAQLAAMGDLRSIPLPRGETPTESIESVIRRRGSTRVFDRTASISLAHLATVLDVSSRDLPTDFLGPGCTSLVGLYLIVHAVEGLPAGSYYYRQEHRALEPLREGDFRNVAGRLGLSQ